MTQIKHGANTLLWTGNHIQRNEMTEMVYLWILALTPKSAHPYLLYNHVCASCYCKPKLNAHWLNSIQRSSAFNHSCCCTHAQRYARRQNVNPLNSVRSRDIDTLLMHHFLHDKLALPLASWWKLLLFCFTFCLISMFSCVSFTYRDCIDYCPRLSALKWMHVCYQSSLHSLQRKTWFP